MSGNKRKMRGTSGKYASAPEKSQKQDESIILEFELKVRKVELDDDDSNLTINQMENRYTRMLMKRLSEVVEWT